MRRYLEESLNLRLLWWGPFLFYLAFFWQMTQFLSCLACLNLRLQLKVSLSGFFPFSTNCKNEIVIETSWKNYLILNFKKIQIHCSVESMRNTENGSFLEVPKSTPMLTRIKQATFWIYKLYQIIKAKYRNNQICL